MPELAGGFLLEDFISTYEVVAELRLARREGRLAACLAPANETPPGTGADMARRASARLAGLIESQAKLGRSHGTPEQQLRQNQALYAVVALIDEIFILEEQWPGQEAWLDELLEYRLFRTRVAGQRFFDYAEQLVLGDSGSRDAADLAAIFLLALRLGFHGRYRGCADTEHLEELRRRLLVRTQKSALANTAKAPGEEKAERLFPQAYEFVVEGKDSRLAPLKPWLRAAAVGLVAYLLLSSAVWLALLEPFLNRPAGP